MRPLPQEGTDMVRRDSPVMDDDILAIRVLLVEILQELARTHPNPNEFLEETRRRLVAAAARLMAPQLLRGLHSRCSEAMAEMFDAAQSQCAARGPNDPPLSVEQITGSLRHLLPQD